jgi:hypothetical protein
MTISAVQQVERSRGPASIVWSRGCAQARSALFYASTHRDWLEMAEIGITSSNYAGLSKPASSISMASTNPVDRMIACCWE